MGQLTVTSEDLHLARASGACEEGIRCIKVGQRIDEVPCSLLAWAENVMPKSQQRAAIEALTDDVQSIVVGTVHLGMSGVSGSGSGYGSGDGSGYGYGSGYGSGDGDGSGYGST